MAEFHDQQAATNIKLKLIGLATSVLAAVLARLLLQWKYWLFRFLLVLGIIALFSGYLIPMIVEINQVRAEIENKEKIINGEGEEIVPSKKMAGSVVRDPSKMINPLTLLRQSAIQSSYIQQSMVNNYPSSSSALIPEQIKLETDPDKKEAHRNTDSVLSEKEKEKESNTTLKNKYRKKAKWTLRQICKIGLAIFCLTKAMGCFLWMIYALWESFFLHGWPDL